MSQPLSGQQGRLGGSIKSSSFALSFLFVDHTSPYQALVASSVNIGFENKRCVNGASCVISTKSNPKAQPKGACMVLKLSLV
jgi:hypothetical protein